MTQEIQSKTNEVLLREDFERNLSNVWGYDTLGVEAKRAAMSMLSTKTGMYSKIPLYCKGDCCPYSESCALVPYNLSPIGQPCPIETTQIELRLEGYSKDFDVDESSFTDKNLINDLISHDIMIERCKALIQKEGVLVQDVVAGVSDSGEEFYRPEVSKHWEALERIQKKRNDIYNLMVATRKDKKGNGENGGNSLTTFIAQMQTIDDFVVEERPDTIDVEINN